MKMILLLALGAFSIFAYGGAYDKTLDCEFAALNEASQRDVFCNSLSVGAQIHSCKADLWRKVSYTACNPVTQTSAKTFVFLEEELKTIHEMYAARKLTLSQTNEKIKKINSMIIDEMAYMTASSKNYTDALKEQEANSRSRAVISNAISVLGGYSQSNNSNNIRNNNYLINGQMINCSTNGNLTTCN